jgi:uncharacterized protein (DUF2345 family)
MSSALITFILALILSPSRPAGAAGEENALKSPSQSGDPWAQLAKFSTTGSFPFYFGTSVAISGDIVAVGAPYTNNNQYGSGVVYVYVKPTTGWANMTQAAVLYPSVSSSCDNFGASVSISGNTIVVGNPQNFFTCIPSGPGAAYVYVEPAGGWRGSLTETALLTASDGVTGDALGNSVSLSGNTIVAGAPSAFPSAGAAYVFSQPAGGWTSGNQTAKLTSSDAQGGDLFGSSVSLSGNTAVIGAPDAAIGANQVQGAAYVFTEPASGWASGTQTAKLTASDGNAVAQLGQSVSISGSTIAAGAPGTVIGGNLGQGAAYTFVEPAGGWRNMAQTAKLTATVGYAGDYLGDAISIDGNTLVAGAPYFSRGDYFGPYGREGAVYVFTKPPGGWVNSSSTLYLTGADSRFIGTLGASVGVSGKLVVAGAPRLAQYSGAPYLFLLP